MLVGYIIHGSDYPGVDPLFYIYKTLGIRLWRFTRKMLPVSSNLCFNSAATASFARSLILWRCSSISLSYRTLFLPTLKQHQCVSLVCPARLSVCVLSLSRDYDMSVPLCFEWFGFLCCSLFCSCLLLLLPNPHCYSSFPVHAFSQS